MREYKLQTLRKTEEIGREGISFWRARITAYGKLSRAEAVARLIKAEKIEAKIQTIEKAINIRLPQ